jgi:hypothetical protein
MTPEQQEDMEAAMLAGMVKGKMKNIDSLMESRPDVPADKINLHSFVDKIKQNSISNNNNITNIESVNPVSYHNPTQNNQPTPNSFVADDKLKDDIDSIKSSLEKINNNLTKLCGMFGKVFHSLTKNEKNG